MVSQGEKIIVLNFEKVTYINSAILAVLLHALFELNRRGGHLLLAALGARLFSVFAIARFEKAFRIFETDAETLAFLRGPISANA